MATSPPQSSSRRKEGGMLSSSVTFMKVRGIPIGAHWSWVFVFGLIAWTLISYLFPSAYPGLSQASYVGMGTIAAVVFFASILLHELGHAFRAMKEGMEIDGITLWLFGGVARFSGMFPSAGAEFRIAVAGPIVSVVLAAIFLGGAEGGAAQGWPVAVTGVLDYLGRINAIVVGFNLVPALPLDGGRMLRAWLWYRRGNFTSATLSAARGGRAFAYFMIGAGVLLFFTGGATSGLWMVFLGWFLLQAVQAEASFAFLRQVFRDFKVRDLMTPDPVTVPRHTSVNSFLDEYVGARGHSTYPVVDQDRVAGLISLRMAGAVPREERDSLTVGEVMLSGEELPTVSPEDQMLDVLTRMREGPGRAVVVDDGRVAGIISTSDLARAVQIEQLRGGEEEQRGGTWIAWVVLLALLVAAGAVYHPPLAVIEPGPAVDIREHVSISGVELDEVNGTYLLTSVGVFQPNALGVVIAMFDPSQDVTEISAVRPTGVDEGEFIEEQRELFRESRRIAAIAAAQAAGMEVQVSGRGAQVVAAVQGTPADGRLQEGDVIVGVDDAPIGIASDLVRVISSRPAGTTFRLRVERGSREIEVDITSADIDFEDGRRPGIGVVIVTRDFSAELPFEVTFSEQEIGGPSAGLAYALVIADLLDPGDNARGRTIAATGTIDYTGAVGPVGGVELKAVAARTQGADVFLIPVNQVGQVRLEDLEVRGVGALAEALEILRAGA